MKSTEVLKLVASVAVCQLAGIIGSVFTASSVSTWYAALRKPSFTPPGWVFGPVWISLYALMGIAAYLVWRNGLNQREVRIALSLFVAQLILNALWSAMFFGFRSPLAGLVDISALWVLIVLTIFYFLRVSTTAGLLLVPYIVWVSFAAVLNYYLWAMNT
jgi:tryptophan-rich sensory protein